MNQVMLASFAFYLAATALLAADPALHTKPAEAVQANVDAYNAHDAHRFAATYAATGVAERLNGAMKIEGQAEMERQYTNYFATLPTVHCTVVERTVMGSFVVDHQRITSDGKPSWEAMVISEVRDGKIVHAWSTAL